MRLLLAEDEIELAKALETLLKHNNYSVDVVHNGLDAYDYISMGEYDAAILDIMMPKMDGITVLKKLRGDGNSIPILMLTAKAEIDDRVTGLDAGADDYLTKPFNMKELMARIRALTRRKGETTDNAIRVGNTTLDRSTYILSTDKGEIRLSGKEFQMLEMFFMNAGQIISVDQFMDKIWGFESEAEQNVVWVNISYLRRKLEELGSNVSIKSTRGLGYSVEVSES